MTEQKLWANTPAYHALMEHAGLDADKAQRVAWAIAAALPPADAPGLGLTDDERDAVLATDSRDVFTGPDEARSFESALAKIRAHLEREGWTDGQ